MPNTASRVTGADEATSHTNAATLATTPAPSSTAPDRIGRLWERFSSFNQFVMSFGIGYLAGLFSFPLLNASHGPATAWIQAALISPLVVISAAPIVGVIYFAWALRRR